MCKKRFITEGRFPGIHNVVLVVNQRSCPSLGFTEPKDTRLVSKNFRAVAASHRSVSKIVIEEMVS